MTSKRAQARKSKSRPDRQVLSALGFADGPTGLPVVKHDLHFLLVENPDTVGPVQFHITDDPKLIAEWIAGHVARTDSVDAVNRPIRTQVVKDYWRRAQQFLDAAQHPYAVLATRRARNTTGGRNA